MRDQAWSMSANASSISRSVMTSGGLTRSTFFASGPRKCTRPARAVIRLEHAAVGQFGVLHLDAVDESFAADRRHEGKFVAQRVKAFPHALRGGAAPLDDLLFLKHIEHGANGRTRARVAAERVGRFAVVHGINEIRTAHDRRRGLSVADALAQDDQVGLHPVGLVGVHVAGAAVTGLHLVENEHDAVLIAPRLQHLVIPAGRMKRPGRAEIGFGDQQRNLAGEFSGQRVEFVLVELPGALFFHGKRDEPHVGVGAFGTGDVSRESLLAVESVARSQHDRALGLMVLCGPHGLLNALRTARAPEDFLCVRVGGGHARHEPFRRENFHFRHHVVGVARQCPGVFAIPFLKPGMAMPEIGHQHARREIQEPPAVNGPEGAALGLFHGQLRRRVGALPSAHHGVQPFADRICPGFSFVLNGLECACLRRHDLYTFPVCRKNSAKTGPNGGICGARARSREST